MENLLCLKRLHISENLRNLKMILGKEDEDDAYVKANSSPSIQHFPWSADGARHIK